MAEERTPMALCPRDGTPLISTMVFRRAEFYCLECGAKLGFLSPRPGDPTPDLTARYEALLAEWNEHVKGKLLFRGWRLECRKCDARAEPHPDHATPEERAAHEAAVVWLEERITRNVA